jgi:anti-sigma B factor antagonist
MALHIDKHLEGHCARLRFAGELTIYDAGALHQALLASLAESDSIELDLAGVTELDTAGFQQLYLLQRESLAAHKRVRIGAHSPATREVFELLRADALFDGPA